MDKQKIKQDIKSVGYSTIKDFFTQDELTAFEVCLVELFLLQAQKIVDYREAAFDIQSSKKTNFEKFSAIYEMMEKNDKEALYQVQKFLPSSPLARALFNEKFISLMSSLLGSNKNRLLIDGPALFVVYPCILMSKIVKKVSINSYYIIYLNPV